MIPSNLTKQHLLKAITKIDEEGIPDYAQSQYYDVIFNKKRYPPKLIISYANLFANGSILDRKSFHGGVDTPCFDILKQNGFLIKRKKEDDSHPKIWFVTQGATFTSNKGMKFLWAPSKGKDERPRFYWENLLKVKKGDIIFNYSGGLKGISLAKSDGYNSINEDTTSKWAKEGYRVDIDLITLNPFISKEQLINKKSELNIALNSINKKPFNSTGSINEGYLYEFTKEAGKIIRDIYGKDFGNEEVDYFFDDVTYSPTPQKIEYISFNKDIYDAGLHIDKKISLRFIASLLTKPFVILTGLSGSGKTKLAQAFAMWICGSEEQYRIVPVGADWTNREPLLGFPNALDPEKYIKPDNGVLDLIIEANNDAEKPYFLILDEMNLSHVERYFADFLSVMESNKEIPLHNGSKDWHGIPSKINIPKNLFIIGTVNVDETTYMFSPKVLDRANVIEFRITKEEMQKFLSDSKVVDLNNFPKGTSMAEDFVKTAKDKDLDANNEELQNTLLKFFSELKKTGAEFGYRSASEIMRFSAVAKKIDPAWEQSEIIDAAIMQKLLPKIHGSRSRLVPILTMMAKLCVKNGVEEYNEKDKEFLDKFFERNKEIAEEFKNKIIYPLSFEKIYRMYYNAVDNGFTSYSEA